MKDDLDYEEFFTIIIILLLLLLFFFINLFTFNYLRYSNKNKMY